GFVKFGVGPNDRSRKAAERSQCLLVFGLTVTKVGTKSNVRRGAHEPPLTTTFLSEPIPSMRTSTVSPAFIGPIPDVVPVAIRSPGRRVMTLVTNSTRKKGSKI